MVYSSIPSDGRSDFGDFKEKSVLPEIGLEEKFESDLPSLRGKDESDLPSMRRKVEPKISP